MEPSHSGPTGVEASGKLEGRPAPRSHSPEFIGLCPGTNSSLLHTCVQLPTPADNTALLASAAC